MNDTLRKETEDLINFAITTYGKSRDEAKDMVFKAINEYAEHLNSQNK